MTKNKEIEISPDFRPPEKPVRRAQGRRRVWGRVDPCPCRRMGARAALEIFSKNTSTSVTSSDTYPDDERIQGRHGGYDPSTYQTMPPRREPHRAAESNFPDITQLGEAMAHAFQNAIRPPSPQRTPLETMYNLKLDRFMGNEGHKGAEKWLDHIEKTFQVMQSQGNLHANRWVETTTWFLGREPAAWWVNQTKFMSPEMAADWEVFKEHFMKRFVPPEYIDRKKQEFTHLKQNDMLAHEYYRKFTDLSHYDPDTAGNQAEMLRCFKLGTKKKWRTFASALPCTDYHEFSEILVRMEDSDNLPSNSEDDEDKNANQKKEDRGKGISTQGPRKTQNFKRSGASSSSSSGGFSVTGPTRGGRFAGGPRFQRQRDFGGTSGSGVPLCRRCNFRHHGKCRRSGGACYTCGQMGHRAAQCPQSQQRSQQSTMPPPAPIQQNFGSGSYGQTGRGGAYHYQGDTAPYAPEQYQYSQDPYSQTGEVNPDRERLLLAVQDRLGSLASQDRDVLLRGEVTKATEVVVDNSKLRDVLITSHCKMLRIIRT
ncbi:hypothetical protein EV1_003423 [Malus domestica]